MLVSKQFSLIYLTRSPQPTNPWKEEQESFCTIIVHAFVKPLVKNSGQPPKTDYQA